MRVEPFRPWLRGGVVLLAAIAGVASAADKQPTRAEIVVNIDFTAEGRKVPRPTPEKPAYYVPVIFGYHEAGGIVAGERPPSRQEMLKQLGKALAKEGYVLQALRPKANETLPSLIITVEWGSMNPMTTDFGALDLSTGDGGTMAPGDVRTATDGKADFNQSEMITLVAGGALYRGAASGMSQTEWEKLRDAVQEGRYFIVVSAYDFAASLKHERKLLWRARMSTERQGVWMDDVVPVLVAAGAPIFGREMDKPMFSIAPIREGRVEVGTPTVVEPAPPAK